MRKLRELAEGARYHVVARANRREMIMKSREMKELFMQVLIRAKGKYRFRLENFCILGNHYHLVIQPENGENLSRIMQWIMSRFASEWNKANGMCGHVWGGRFFSRILSSIRDLVATFGYIDENPVKAGLVYEAADWQYGGLRESREGNHGVLDRLPPWILSFLPAWQVCLLA